jgi:preprotein translocase subunit SecG
MIYIVLCIIMTGYVLLCNGAVMDSEASFGRDEVK